MWTNGEPPPEPWPDGVLVTLTEFADPQTAPRAVELLRVGVYRALFHELARRGHVNVNVQLGLCPDGPGAFFTDGVMADDPQWTEVEESDDEHAG